MLPDLSLTGGDAASPRRSRDQEEHENRSKGFVCLVSSWYETQGYQNLPDNFLVRAARSASIVAIVSEQKLQRQLNDTRIAG
jgi:hypothetical protein